MIAEVAEYINWTASVVSHVVRPHVFVLKLGRIMKKLKGFKTNTNSVRRNYDNQNPSTLTIILHNSLLYRRPWC